MNEVKNHYAGAEHGGGGRTSGRSAAGASRGGSGVAGSVKAKAEGVLDSANDAYERAADWGKDTYRGASSWAADRYGSARQSAGDARRRGGDGFDRTRRQVTDFVEENPVMVGVVGVAAGLLLGSLLPGTKRENRAFGRYADEVREQGFRYAQDLAQQGKHLVEEGLSAAVPRGDRDTGDETSAS